MLVDLEGHGWEDIGVPVNLSRTVGWFTSSYPLLPDPVRGVGAGEALKALKEQLRQVPNRGIGYAALPKSEGSFNYMGQQDLGGNRAPAAHMEQNRGSIGSTQSQKGRRGHLFEINGGYAAAGSRCAGATAPTSTSAPRSRRWPRALSRPCKMNPPNVDLDL